MQPKETVLETVSLEMTAAKVRPSRLVAEALVLRHGSAEVKQRARAMGLSENLTEAVVSVCCRDVTTIDDQSETSSHN
jgi:hypothetical protein